MISAFLFGRARRPIFIEVPTADPRNQLDGVLTTLVGSLYGPRDAPLIWQDRLRCRMKLLGFKESLRVPCKLYQETKDVEKVAHVDDIAVVGCSKDVQDVYRGLASTFERKCKYAGPKTRNGEVEYLGRRIVYMENGRKIHGDPKHAAILLKEIGMEMCKSCELTPCCRHEFAGYFGRRHPVIHAIH